MDKSHLFLLHTWQVSRGIHHKDQRNIVSIADADKARALICCVGINAARKVHGIIGNKAHRLAIDAAESGDHIGREVLLNLNDVLVVAQLDQQVHHVVASIGVIRHEGVEVFVFCHFGVGRRSEFR